MSFTLNPPGMSGWDGIRGSASAWRQARRDREADVRDVDSDQQSGIGMRGAEANAGGEDEVLASLFDHHEEQGWQERALCAQTDPEAFFPEKGGSTREAKRICQSCEVRAECLEYALAHDERFGIWGGMSERERRKLRKRAV
jgi:WhiB family redox-sensing transcriptional regulator